MVQPQINNEQIQDWLTEISDLWKTANSKKIDSRKLLSECASKTHLLIGYLNANYDDFRLCQSIMAQLLALYYRLGVPRCFVLQLIPTMTNLYLLSLAKKWKKCAELFELFFLAIYNEEILDGGTGAPAMTKRVDEVRIPSVRFPSVYHDPQQLIQLPEAVGLKYINSCVQNTIRIGPYPAVNRIIAENRYVVLTRVMRVVNNSLSRMASEVVGRHLCLSLMAICRSGFSFTDSDFRQRVLGVDASDEHFGDFAKKPRLVVSPHFLIECLNGVNFAFFNGHADVALRALEAVHRRAHFEIFPDVLLDRRCLPELLYSEKLNCLTSILHQIGSRHFQQTNALRNSLLDPQTVRILFES